LQSAAQQYVLVGRRRRTLEQISRARGATVITLIHRQETMSLLGFPLVRYIDIDDAESTLLAIRATPKGQPIEIILHTPGGLVVAARQIAAALADHDGPVTAVVPHYAMSGGTLIALGADEIVMDAHARSAPSTRSSANIQRPRSLPPSSGRAAVRTRRSSSPTSHGRRSFRSSRSRAACSSA
jgi:ClpP class serine protease